MKDDRHLEGFQISTQPFEEIIPKQVTVVINVNSKLSKYGLHTSLFCSLLGDNPQPLSPRSIRLCFIFIINVGLPGHREQQFKCHEPEKIALTTLGKYTEQSNPKYQNCYGHTV